MFIVRLPSGKPVNGDRSLRLLLYHYRIFIEIDLQERRLVGQRVDAGCRTRDAKFLFCHRLLRRYRSKRKVERLRQFGPALRGERRIDRYRVAGVRLEVFLWIKTESSVVPASANSQGNRRIDRHRPVNHQQ